MNKETGEIKPMSSIRKNEIEKWYEPFYVGKQLNLLGVSMEIVKIKKVRGELVLKHKRVEFV